MVSGRIEINEFAYFYLIQEIKFGSDPFITKSFLIYQQKSNGQNSVFLFVTKI